MLTTWIAGSWGAGPAVKESSTGWLRSGRGGTPGTTRHGSDQAAVSPWIRSKLNSEATDKESAGGRNAGGADLHPALTRCQPSLAGEGKSSVPQQEQGRERLILQHRRHGARRGPVRSSQRRYRGWIRVRRDRAERRVPRGTACRYRPSRARTSRTRVGRSASSPQILR